MPKYSLYLTWMDPVFYFWGALFAASLVALVYSIRKRLELQNSDYCEPEEEEPSALPPPVSDGPVEEEVYTPLPEAAAPEPAPAGLSPAEPETPPAAAPEAAVSPAENFVRGIYVGISGLDARLKDIELSLSKGRSNNEFAVKFLEDIAADIDSLDKAKIKARLEFLLADLKK